MSPPMLPDPPAPAPPPPPARRPRRTKVVVGMILVAGLVNAGVVAAVLIGSGEEGSGTRASSSTLSPSPTPLAPFEIVREHPADGPIGDWAQMRATDGSFAFYGPVGSYIVPIDGWAAYNRWGSSGWGENRVVVGDDRLYELGCKADDQRALEDGRRFTDSFEPTI